ncbi:hypothetical protein GALMADRAFT_148064 [Galerina marginata CBS 339.88]|uniref:Uncharacterized protein n=1 Tax=Galerina marginata (strain CBS 339.88) TaxID=685588 RepID=A0A067SEI5_GALM3|nr:hypothetical protein GALMADRAFT_148064 [Galerina marginata CBS 339.88]
MYFRVPKDVRNVDEQSECAGPTSSTTDQQPTTNTSLPTLAHYLVPPFKTSRTLFNRVTVSRAPRTKHEGRGNLEESRSPSTTGGLERRERLAGPRASTSVVHPIPLPSPMCRVRTSSKPRTPRSQRFSRHPPITNPIAFVTATQPRRTRDLPLTSPPSTLQGAGERASNTRAREFRSPPSPPAVQRHRRHSIWGARPLTPNTSTAPARLRYLEATLATKMGTTATKTIAGAGTVTAGAGAS